MEGVQILFRLEKKIVCTNGVEKYTCVEDICKIPSCDILDC